MMVLGGIAAWVLTSPGWPEVREPFFYWSEFKHPSPTSCGFWLDVKLMVIVEVAVLIVGLVVALDRTSRAPSALPRADARNGLRRPFPRISRRSSSST